MQYTSETLKKKILQNTETAFALLLPHKQDGIEFGHQYTAIYADWEVLLIDDCITSKRFSILMILTSQINKLDT